MDSKIKDLAKNIKVIATDMDGTLLNSDHRISNRTKEAITKAAEKGLYFILASGRSYDSMLPFYDELGLDSILVSYNGALAIEPKTEKIFHRNYVLPNIVADCFAMGEETGIYVQFYYDGKAYYIGDKDIAHRYGVSTEIYPEPYVPAIMDISKCHKGMFIATDDKQAQQLIELQDKFKKSPLWMNEGLSVFSNPYYLEILNPTSSKKNALFSVLSQLGYTLDQVCAFGDALNDYDMVLGAGIGVAMDNSLPQLKADAPFHTKTNDEDGVAHFLEQYIL